MFLIGWIFYDYSVRHEILVEKLKNQPFRNKSKSWQELEKKETYSFESFCTHKNGIKIPIKVTANLHDFEGEKYIRGCDSNPASGYESLYQRIPRNGRKRRNP